MLSAIAVGILAALAIFVLVAFVVANWHRKGHYSNSRMHYGGKHYRWDWDHWERDD